MKTPLACAGTTRTAKPFLKWAGGKSQLIEQIARNLPEKRLNQKFTYIEPFVGSGAVLFWMLERFPAMEKAVILDVNQDLINVWKVIAEAPGEIIAMLQDIQDEFHALETDPEKKKDYYYQKRALYNSRASSNIFQAALFIFLNRTCYNGLYRVNRKNEYNVPVGSYKKPVICDAQNIMAVNSALRNTEIVCADFEKSADYARGNSFFYFDPPYKPLSQTSSFNAYSKQGFNDDEQIRLRDFCRTLNQRNKAWLLSNSDPKNEDPANNFFDLLYSEFHIQRVKARRSINSDSAKRGRLNEILIKNY